MKRLSFPAILIASLLVGARADYLVKETIDNAGQTQDVTLKIKGAKCRVDATQQTSAIMDSATGELAVLIHPQKAFIKVSKEQLAAQAKAMKDMLGNQSGTPANVELKPTGKKETINGYPTEEYTYDLNGIHNTVTVDPTFPHYQELVSAMYNVQNGPGLEMFRSLALPPGKFPGMPIRTTVEVMGQKVVTTIASVQQVDLSDAEFSVPGGYKELQLKAAPPDASPSASPGS
jgi:hypothetical protein